MSSPYPVMQLSYKTSAGQTIKLGERVLVVDGGIDPLGLVYHIEDSSDGKTVKVVLVNEVRNLLNAFAAGQRLPPIKSGKAGYYNMDDYQGHGLVFISIEGADDEQIRAAYVKLKEWHDRHGSTGGTNDGSINANPADIPFEPTGTGEGKEGEQGGDPTGGGAVEGGGHPGKTGEGDAQLHQEAADRDDSGGVSQKEANKYERKTGVKVDVTE